VIPLGPGARALQPGHAGTARAPKPGDDRVRQAGFGDAVNADMERYSLLAAEVGCLYYTIASGDVLIGWAPLPGGQKRTVTPGHRRAWLAFGEQPGADAELAQVRCGLGLAGEYCRVAV
jgi:hypothetical protein